MVTKAVNEIPAISSKATAYGSQRHIFNLESGALAVWINPQKKITFSYSDKNNSWKDFYPVTITDEVANVSGVLDKDGNLHLAYESKGQIIYRKVSGIVSTGQIQEIGISSAAVKLDLSGMAYRPSIIVNEDNLPMVLWTAGGLGVYFRYNTIRYLRAKTDSTSIKNWCNAKGDSCGTPAFIKAAGSSDFVDTVRRPAKLHTVLSQMPKSGDLYAYLTDDSKKGSEVLKMSIARKEGNHWRWEEPVIKDNIAAESAKNFNLAVAVDRDKEQIITAYTQKDGQTKIVAYQDKDKMKDLALNQNLGGQLTLTAENGRIYVSYRKENGKIGAIKYDGIWSKEIFESTGFGGYPSLADKASGNKIPFIYTLQDGRVEIGSLE